MAEQIYSDLNLDFNANPFTGDLIKLTNADSIKRSVRNLVSTNFYESPFDPQKGTGIRGSLFENFNPLNVEFLKKKITELIDEREPRIKINSITINQQEDYNSLQISIVFTIVEINKKEQITVFVGRTR